jgi:hypothetical protein
MTTEKQFAANRQNAKNSTGPRSEHGKRRSRRNAFRHGLAAETVIDVLEDPADYKALASRINADYRPRTNFELELVARLVSLLWRLRRAVAIEGGLFEIQAQALRKRSASARYNKDKLRPFYALIPALTPIQGSRDLSTSEAHAGPEDADRLAIKSVPSEIARSFSRVSSSGELFERLGRYEMKLWRQTVQIILLLNSINDRPKDYADFKGEPYLVNLPRRRRRVFWPPFMPSN